MDTEYDKIYAGATEDEVWQPLAADLNAEEDLLEYHALIKQDGHEISLDIEIDLGGGFEGGFANTVFGSPISNADGFKFAIHEEHFSDEIGKFFGMEDIKTGYDELDHHLIIKSNNVEKVKSLFNDPKVRAVFEKLADFDFGIQMVEVEDTDFKQPYLELNIEDGITEPEPLREIYSAFYSVLTSL